MIPEKGSSIRKAMCITEFLLILSSKSQLKENEQRASEWDL